MEDYELIALLRKRLLMLPRLQPISAANKTEGANKYFGEKLHIIGGEPALCSPRRWQKFGVLYVTFMNSKFVNLYASGMNADELYKLYYGQSPPSRVYEVSPWELELDSILKTFPSE